MLIITLSTTAVAHITGFLSKYENSMGIRIGLERSGCTGFKYVIDVVFEKNTDDILINTQNVDIFIPERFTNQLNGLKIDYVYEETNEGLVFDNPNTKNMCGCGESFEV